LTEELVDWIRDNPEEYIVEVAAEVEEYAPTGPTIGYKFTSVPSGSLASELGIQVDDIVVDIDGYDVGDMDNWAPINSSLSTATSVTVGYERNGISSQLTIEFED